MDHSKRILFLLASIMLAGVCHAQDGPELLPTGRHGKTADAVVLPLHSIMWENGSAFEKGLDGARTLTLNTTLLRYGIFPNMEIYVGTDFQMFDNGQTTSHTFGVAPLCFGAKMKVHDGSGIIPSIGLTAELTSPHIGSKELLPSHLAPSLNVGFENYVSDWFEFFYSIGVEWDGETAVPYTILALALSFSFTDNIGAYVETYNYLHPENGNQYMSEIGFTWALSKCLQVDLECDFDLQHLGSYFAIGGGLAWMIK